MLIEFPLTIEMVLQRPLFQSAQVLAGTSGIKREVRWVHILEITAAAPFINENDLILTTGLSLQQAEKRKQYMVELINQKAAGLCVELGDVFPHIPADMIDMANAYDFPLIVFSHPVRFVDITQDIHSLLINRHHHMLQEMESFSRELQQLTLQPIDIKTILETLYKKASLPIVYYSMTAGVQSFPHSLTPHFQHVVAQNVDAFFKDNSLEPLYYPIDLHQQILFQPVICMGNTLSYVGIALPAQNNYEYFVLLLDYAAKAIGHLLLRKLFIQERMMESDYQFIEDILQNKIRNENHARTRIGLLTTDQNIYWMFAGIFHFYVAKKTVEEMESIKQDLLVFFRSIFQKYHVRSIFMPKNHHLYVMCIKESPDITLEKWKEKIKKIVAELQNKLEKQFPKGVSFTVGFSSPKHRMTDMYTGFMEAHQALEVTSLLPDLTVPFYDEIGIFQLLTGISDSSVLQSFIDCHLKPLFHYEKETNIPLLETLTTYLKCMGNKQESAEKLYIHRQTLYHRLEKCKELLGEDFLEPEKRICIELALYARQFLNR